MLLYRFFCEVFLHTLYKAVSSLVFRCFNIRVLLSVLRKVSIRLYTFGFEIKIFGCYVICIFFEVDNPLNDEM